MIRSKDIAEGEIPGHPAFSADQRCVVFYPVADIGQGTTAGKGVVLHGYFDHRRTGRTAIGIGIGEGDRVGSRGGAVGIEFIQA